MHTLYGYGMMGGRGMMYPYGGYGLGFGPLEFLAFVLLAAIVIGLIVWLVVRKTHGSNAGGAQGGAPAAPAAQDSALAIARERLARGEIDTAQYEAIVKALHG